jgi:hypothetical protein
MTGLISGEQMTAVDLGNIRLAGVFVGAAPGTESDSLIFALSLFGCVILPFGSTRRKRAAVLAAAILLMATALAGCGGGSSGGATAVNASRQQVVAIDSEDGSQVAVANLPIDLGIIHKQ